MDIVSFSITMVLYYLAVLLGIAVIAFSTAYARKASKNGNRGYKLMVPIIIVVLVFGALAGWFCYIHYE